MASSSGRSACGSGSGSASHEIDEEAGGEYKRLLDTEEVGEPNNTTRLSKRTAMSSQFWRWLPIQFFRTKPPGEQPDLTSISAVAPVSLEETGTPQRDNNHIQRNMAPVMRNIKSFFGRAVIRSSSMLSLTDSMSAELMGFLSNAAMLGIMTLNIYSATYFLAWRKENSFCNFPLPPEIFHKADAVTRLIVTSLPFICFPLALVIGALAIQAQKDVRFLGCVTGLVLCEIIYILFLGSLMMTCMANVSGTHTGIAAVFLLFLILFLWGCCCHRPKRLRSMVLSKCCCPDVDEAT